MALRLLLELGHVATCCPFGIPSLSQAVDSI
jgi:hypothetical protein